MMKKLFAAFCLLGTLVIGASAAPSIFPAARTGADGITQYGYLSETGETVLAFAYAHAGEFADCGLAAVEDDKWHTAVIDRTGKLVVPYVDSPVSVEFSADAIAYRYADRSVYYSLTGEQIGAYPGAEGFFSDGLLLVKNQEDGLYRYVGTDGQPAFEGAFDAAGAFVNGRAVVRLPESGYAVIDAAGAALFQLDSDFAPVYPTIYGADTLIVTDGEMQALYSLSGGLLTDFIYTAISEFHEGAAMARQASLWGLIDTTGRVHTAPSYHYLSYMGGGLYAARGSDGAVAAVDADGNIAYRTPEYRGGFDELRYGLSWHGMPDGSVVFFRRNGGFAASLSDAESPRVLTENVVRVTQDGTEKYVNLATGSTLFEQPMSFSLGAGVTANTVHYEKFLGYQADGSEHGWNVDFPEIAGLPDAEMQKKLNAAIRDFFLKGPSISAEYEALEGGYGVSLEGSVLVVSANCVSGKGKGASVWNNSLAFDLRTGTQYRLEDLTTRSFTDTVRTLLPAEHAIYLYSFPRMSREGVTYYYNEYESETRRAYTESYLLTFEQLGDTVDKESACYQALHTPYALPTVTGFSDVLTTHWAAEPIRQVFERGLMHGADGKFRPNDLISSAETCVTIARAKALVIPTVTAENGVPAAWYAGEVKAVEDAGLLAGLSEAFSPNAALSRADAMQLFANALTADGKTLPDDAETAALLLPFSDADTLPESRRAAAALCIREGLIEGANGRLDPLAGFTRAQFAKLLLLI